MFKLKKGDKVGIVSPSSFITNKEWVEKGTKYLKSLGLVPVFGKHVYGKYRFMSGTAEQRANELKTFYKDPEIKAIFASAGGGGSLYVLDKLDFDIIKKNPKPLIGFSDTTALQNGIYSRVGNVNPTGFTLHYDFRDGQIDKSVDRSLMAVLFGKELVAKGGKTIRKGMAEGRLVGGCLSVLCYLCGTKYFPDLKDAILILEDVSEKTYRIALLLQQIKMQPNFDKVKGIVFGKFTDSTVFIPEDGTPDEVIDYFCKDLKIPVIKDFPYSHEKSRYVLPLGAKVRLDAMSKALEIMSIND